MEELKKCPYCGNQLYMSANFEIASFSCEECGYEIDLIISLYGSVDECIKEMNNRPIEKEIQSRLNQQTIELYKALDERDEARDAFEKIVAGKPGDWTNANILRKYDIEIAEEALQKLTK